MKKIIQSKNPVLRLWGNVAGYIGSWFLSYADKYGDLYDFSEMLSSLEGIDDTGVWKDDG
jgi:hypothetical protein